MNDVPPQRKTQAPSLLSSLPSFLSPSFPAPQHTHHIPVPPHSPSLSQPCRIYWEQEWKDYSGHYGSYGVRVVTFVGVITVRVMKMIRLQRVNRVIRIIRIS